MSLAQSLGGKEAIGVPPCGNGAPASETEDSMIDSQMFSTFFSLLSQYNGADDQRAALLSALRPFVKEQRYAKIDKAIQIAKLSRFMRSALELFRSKEESHV